MLKTIWSDFENERFFVFFGFFSGKFTKICTFLAKYAQFSKKINNEGRKVKGRQIAKFIQEISRVSSELLSGE
ncbi:MAG: hypothetical protein ABIL62_18770 [Planctomycetota bacterium]